MHKASVSIAAFSNLGKIDENDDFSHFTVPCKDILIIDTPQFEKGKTSSNFRRKQRVFVKDNKTGELKSVLKMYSQKEEVLRDTSTMN